MDNFLIMPWFPMWLAQILRGFCIIAAPSAILFSLRLARRYRQRGPQCRFAGLGFLLAASAYTEIARWDDPVTPRLFINLAGIIFSILGLRSIIKGKG